MKYLLSLYILFTVTIFTSGLVHASTPLSPEARVLACQDKESEIKDRSLTTIQNAENILQSFDGVATRVETYYETTTLPSGKVAGNYSMLTADIDTKQQAVIPLIAKAKETLNSFGCTTADPKEQIAQFTTDMQGVKQGLQEYREAIRALILAINAV